MNDFLLREITTSGFTGQIILHYQRGRVVEYEKREKIRPVPRDEATDAEEVAEKGDGV